MASQEPVINGAETLREQRRVAPVSLVAHDVLGYSLPISVGASAGAVTGRILVPPRA